MTIPIEVELQIWILVASTVSIFIPIVAVGLRLLAKKIRKELDYSDYCIVVALVCNTTLNFGSVLMVIYGGLGFDIVTIVIRFGEDTLTSFYKGIISFVIVWNATLCFSKLSILLIYTIIIPNYSMIKWVRCLGALVVVWTLADVITLFLICQPFSLNWNDNQSGHCGNQAVFLSSMGLLNSIADSVIIALPMPYLHRLKLPWRKRLVAMALFGVGIATWAITIYRQILLPRLNWADPKETTHSCLTLILCGLETAVAIVVVCIPLMRPLFSRRTLQSIRTGYEHDSKPRNEPCTQQAYQSTDPQPSNLHMEWFEENNTLSHICLQTMRSEPLMSYSYSQQRESEASHSRPIASAVTSARKWELTTNQGAV